jgi:hypothetical protein
MYLRHEGRGRIGNRTYILFILYVLKGWTRKMCVQLRQSEHQLL